MKNNAPTFAFIGKPNNGKSSIISALTFDDRIEISKEVGTTTTSQQYSYMYNSNVVCNFYDTPGFEQAKHIWNYIKKDEDSYGHNSLREFMQEYKSQDSMKKDIEIVEAILDSDFIVFVINISQNYNQNVIGYELEIIKSLKKPLLILFNQIGDNENLDEWREKLKEYDLNNTHSINPLSSSYQNISNIYTSLYTIDSSLEDKLYLDQLLRTHRKHLEENKQNSSSEIAKMLVEILQYENIYKTSHEKITQDDKEKALHSYQNKIYEIENRYKKKIENIWGYYQVNVVDERPKIDSEQSIRLGLTKERLVALSSVLGVGAGAILGSPLAILDAGISSVIFSSIGGLVAGGSAYLASDKFSSFIISKKSIIHKIDKRNYNVSFILLKRSLEHLDRLIKHGHANRTDIVIPKDSSEWKFNSEFSFEDEVEKKIAKIHSSIVNDENTIEVRDELSSIILETMTILT